MTHLIISGHGKFAEGMQGALSLIAGDLEHISFVSFQDNPDTLKSELQNIIKANADKECVIFTDLVGGTPFKTAALLSKDYPLVKVIGGTNLPMLLSIAYEDGASADEICEIAVEAGKSGVAKFQGF